MNWDTSKQLYLQGQNIRKMEEPKPSFPLVTWYFRLFSLITLHLKS